MKINKESFEWITGTQDLPKDRLLKGVAKTTATTLHPTDPQYPVRVFAEVELMRNAASLVGRPVGRNHEKYPIFGAYAVDSEWNEEEKQLECLLYVPSAEIQKVKDGKIKECSIEYTWRDEKKTNEGTEFQGLAITRIDLVEGQKAGDSGAIVSLFETKEKRGVMLAGLTLGEPFADYKDMNDCIAKNQDKEDPAAYCATIMRATETTPTTKEECEAAGGTWNAETKTCKIPEPKTVEALETELGTITEAIQRINTELIATKAARKEQIETAVKESRDKILKAVEAVLPKNFIMRQSNRSLTRLTEDLKKVIRNLRE